MIRGRVVDCSTTVSFQHVVVEADLGTRTIERYKSSKAEFTKYAMENVSSNRPFASPWHKHPPNYFFSVSCWYCSIVLDYTIFAQ